MTIENEFTLNLSKCINELKSNIITESKRDDLLLPYLDILHKKGDNCTLSQLKGFLLKKFSNEFGIYSLSSSSNYYLAGITRYYFEGVLTSNKRLNILYPKVVDKPIGEICQKLDKIIVLLRNSYIDSVGTKFEQPEDFGKLSLDKLLKKYDKKINPQTKEVVEEPKENVDIYGGSAGNGYTYKIIYDYEEAKPYSKYTQPGAWCITYGQQHYNAYIKKLNIHYVFFLKDGFENVPRQVGQGFTKRKPHDEYGNSMIAVLQSNSNPKAVYIISRWNHGYGETSGTEADHAYTQEEFLNVIGADSSILEQCFNQWQEGLKRLKKDKKSVNSEKKELKLTMLRKFKYAQMLLNDGARIEDIFDFYPRNSDVIKKGLYWVGFKTEDGSDDWWTLMDRRTLMFDKVLFDGETNGSQRTINYNDFLIGFYNNKRMMIYNRRKRSFVGANGITKFKHYSYNATDSTSSARYIMFANSGNEIFVLDKERGQMVKAPNGATIFETIVPLSTSFHYDTNTDYRNQIQLCSLDAYYNHPRFYKFIYDSSAKIEFVYDLINNTFINLPKVEDFEIVRRTSFGKESIQYNVRKYKKKMISLRLTESELKHYIMEELKKSEVTSMINSKIDSSLDSREFKKKVKEISAEIVSNLFRTLWQQNNMWKRACQQ